MKVCAYVYTCVCESPKRSIIKVANREMGCGGYLEELKGMESMAKKEDRSVCFFYPKLLFQAALLLRHRQAIIVDNVDIF